MRGKLDHLKEREFVSVLRVRLLYWHPVYAEGVTVPNPLRLGEI